MYKQSINSCSTVSLKKWYRVLCFCFILVLIQHSANMEGFLNSAGSKAWLSEHSFKTKYLEGISFPTLFSSRQFVLNGHFSATVKSRPADSTNLNSKMKSNSPNTSLIVIFHSNFQFPYCSKPELVSPTALFRKWFLLLLFKIWD